MDEPHPYRLGMRDGRWQPHGCRDCDQRPGSDIHDPRRYEETFEVTGWWVGDVLRHPDGRTGRVIGFGAGTVIVRLADGETTESWPYDLPRGTGLHLYPAASEYGGGAAR